jgi:hypothetical protein
VKVSAPVVRFSTWTILLALVVLFSPFAFAADVSVSAPASGAVVSSPFVLQATSATCLSQSTVSMAYSIDSGTDTVFNPATSINASVSASQGTHTLRVKAWGSGTFCETDVAITVGSGVVVSSPVNGSTVPSTFLLNATASTCGGQSTSSMAYSFDSNTDNVISAQSINQNISTSAGSHLLRVKAWGNAGAFCETDLSINVSSQSVVISTPSNNSTVPITFQLQAQAPTCNGRSTSSMTYNFAGHPDAPASAVQSINTSVTAPTTGVQQLNVKAWNGIGDLCETSVSIDAENTVSGNGIVWPTSALNFGPIEQNSVYAGGVSGESAPGAYQAATDNNDTNPCDKGVTVSPDSTDNLWLTQRDCGTNGTKTGMTTSLTPGPGTPPTNTAAREYEVTSATGSSGVTPGIRWSTRLTGAASTYQNFGFDAYVYFENDGSLDRTGRLELDINQSVLNPATNQYDLYIMSHQCNFDTGFWEVGGWQATGQRCGDQTDTRSGFSPGVWHHVQIKAHRVSSTIVFDQVALDGNVQNFTCGGGGTGSCTRTVIANANWQPDGLVVPNFQIDAHLTNGSISSPVKVYVDSFYIYYW